MNKKSTLVLVIMAAIAIFASSCKDKFTEEDLLNAQQLIDYSVVIKDVATLLGIENATVTIVQDGIELTATTNAQGVATFLKISIGNGFPLVITATDYATVTANINTSIVEYRQAEFTSFFYTLSQIASLATVKGVVEIETDVTNQTREVVGAGTVTAVFIANSYNSLSLTNIQFAVTATTAADGTYSMQLPTFGNGVEYDIFVNDIEIGQTIAYSREQGQPVFPATLPQIATIQTAFTDSGSPANIPSGVPSVFATVGAVPTGVGAQEAELDVFGINTSGAITGITFFSSGFGYAASSTTVPITVTSLVGGTGAVVTANTNASGQITGFNITSGGSGYPQGNPNANFNFATFPQNLFNNENIRPGDTKVINIYYGTGSSRVLDIL